MIEILKKAADGQALSAKESEAILAYSDFVQKHLELVEAKYERAQAAAKCLELLECRPSLLRGVDPDIEIDEIEVDDEDDEPASTDPIEMAADIEDPVPVAETRALEESDHKPVDIKAGLPVWGIGEMPKGLITRADLAESVGLSPSGLSWHIKTHPDHPRPVAYLQTVGGGIPSLCFDRNATNTYWQSLGKL